MGIPVLILGESGSGKSASLRNFGEQGIVIYNIASKPLPFRKKMDFVSQGATYEQIKKSMARSTVKSYVIDDSQYLMAFEFFDKANIKGYDKFTEIAVNFRNLIQFIVSTMSSDTIVYFLHHVFLSCFKFGILSICNNVLADYTVGVKIFRCFVFDVSFQSLFA